MIELHTQRKTKVNLVDYDYKRDIEDRLLMSQFSQLDLVVLQEVLFSPLKFSLRKMARSLELSEEQLLDVLKKISGTGLLKVEHDAVTVDKEMRKYYEAQVSKFEEDFCPGIEFLLTLLRKVPIHALPVWYAISRTSNNIFESIIEKYLLTPQTFHRYLQEFYVAHPDLAPIAQDLFGSKELKICAREVMEKYSLERIQFEEIMLIFEFSFIATLSYQKEGENRKEIVVPFDEWREYLLFLRSTQAEPLDDEAVQPYRPNDFSFVEDMAYLLRMAKKRPISLKEGLCFEEPYFSRLVDKLCLVKLADVIHHQLHPLDAAQDWLNLRPEEQSLFLYRHPCNRPVSEEFSSHLCNERTVREAERSIQRVLHAGWILFDDFLKGALVGFSEEPAVVLRKIGKSWTYALPEYTSEQNDFIRAIVLGWLFEAGIVAIGHSNQSPCFRVTKFGQTLFGR